MTKPKRPSKTPSENARSISQNLLQLAQLRAEKCELKEAQLAYTRALQQAKRAHDLKTMMEALAGLLRLAVEALDGQAIENGIANWID